MCESAAEYALSATVQCSISAVRFQNCRPQFRLVYLFLLTASAIRARNLLARTSAFKGYPIYYVARNAALPGKLRKSLPYHRWSVAWMQTRKAVFRSAPGNMLGESVSNSGHHLIPHVSSHVIRRSGELGKAGSLKSARAPSILCGRLDHSGDSKTSAVELKSVISAYALGNIFGRRNPSHIVEQRHPMLSHQATKGMTLASPAAFIEAASSTAAITASGAVWCTMCPAPGTR